MKNVFSITLKEDRFCLDFAIPGNLKGCVSGLGTIVAL
jgi:hypothetical protein